MDYERRIKELDWSVFEVKSKTTGHDRTALLRLQNLVRDAFPDYKYLEIGSSLGGSIFPHLVDPLCGSIVSIDLRPAETEDERGTPVIYSASHSPDKMLKLLRRSAGPGPMSKLRTFERDAADVTPEEIGSGVRLALIDGEHTNRAAFRDFCNVLRTTEPDAIITFHDSSLVLDAVMNAIEMLRFLGRPHTSFFLPDLVFAIALGKFAISTEEALRPYSRTFDEQAAYATKWRQQSAEKQAKAGQR